MRDLGHVCDLWVAHVPKICFRPSRPTPSEQTHDQVAGKPVCVVQIAVVVLAQRSPGTLPRDHPASALEKRPEAALLVEQYAAHALDTGVLPEMLERVLERLHRQVGQRAGRVVAPQRRQHPAHQPAKHVPPPGVRRPDPVADDHDARARR